LTLTEEVMGKEESTRHVRPGKVTLCPITASLVKTAVTRPTSIAHCAAFNRFEYELNL